MEICNKIRKIYVGGNIKNNELKKKKKNDIFGWNFE